MRLSAGFAPGTRIKRASLVINEAPPEFKTAFAVQNRL